MEWMAGADNRFHLIQKTKVNLNQVDIPVMAMLDHVRITGIVKCFVVHTGMPNRLVTKKYLAHLS